MKKVLLFFIFLGISLGVFLGIRNEMLSIDENDEEIYEDDSGDNYIHELNLPIMEIDSFNPLLTYNQQVINILKLIYEPLISIDKEDKLSPTLATEWAQTTDTTYIIKLRDNVLWHNGNKFTSEDVVFTINLLLSEDFNSPYKENVKNVLSVEAIDSFSVLITLNEKDELFAYKLLFPIIPMYYFKDGEFLNENKNNMPIGTGAYKYVTTNETETIMKLEKNNMWWNKEDEVRLENIYLYKYESYGEAIKAYKSSEVDLIVTTMTDWEKKFGTIGNNDYGYESSLFDTIIPNTQKIALSDSSVRKALLYGINRENIINKVFYSNATVVDLPIHTRSKNFLSNLQTEYNIEKAKQALLNGGWQLNSTSWSKNIEGTNCKLKFTLAVNQDIDEHIKIAEIIKENLIDLNIEINIKELSKKDYEQALKNGNFDLILATFDIKNELNILDLLKQDSSLNYARFYNEEVEELIEKIKTNYSDEDVQNLETIYKAETPYIGLFFRNNTILTNKSVKGSIEPTWCNPYENITTWCK